MDNETQREIAAALRQAIGKGQTMLIITGVGQVPLEVQGVERGIVRLVGQLTAVKEVMGQPMQVTMPVNYSVALEAILGVGLIVDPTENGNGGGDRRKLFTP